MTDDATPLGPSDVFPQDVAKKIEQYVDILRGRGIERGLIGPREGGRIFSRHVLNCVAIESLVPHGVDVLDVGSGAGLPGIPLALVRPDLNLTLIEPLLRRYTFLEEVVDELDLSGRVWVERGRAEDMRERFDVVTARAVAPMDRLLGWTAPLFVPRGQLLALKGSSAAEEVEAARRRLDADRLTAEVLQVRAHPEADPTSVVRVRARR